jgi:hypothetical protein
MNTMFGSSLSPVVCKTGGGGHVLFVCVWWCSTRVVLCCFFVCLHLVCPMLPVSLNCPF